MLFWGIILSSDKLNFKMSDIIHLLIKSQNLTYLQENLKLYHIFITKILLLSQSNRVGIAHLSRSSGF